MLSTLLTLNIIKCDDLNVFYVAIAGPDHSLQSIFVYKMFHLMDKSKLQPTYTHLQNLFSIQSFQLMVSPISYLLYVTTYYSSNQLRSWSLRSFLLPSFIKKLVYQQAFLYIYLQNKSQFHGFFSSFLYCQHCNVSHGHLSLTIGVWMYLSIYLNFFT